MIETYFNKNKHKNKLDSITNLISFFSLLFLFQQIFYYKKIAISGYCFILPIILSSSVFVLYITSSNMIKKLSFFVLVFLIFSTPSFIIINDFFNNHFNSIDRKSFFSLFNFIRSIFYYYVIRSIFTFFYYPKKTFTAKIIEVSYFIFILINLTVFLVLNYNLISKSLADIFFTTNHYLCYVFKDVPFIIAIYLSARKAIKKPDLFNLLLISASIFNIFSVIFQLYFIKSSLIINYMIPMMSFQIMMFSLPLFLYIIKIILEDRKIYEINKNELLSQVTTELHNLKNTLSKKKGEIIDFCVENILSTMRWLDEMQIVIENKYNLKHFLEIIIDEFIYSEICQIKNIEIEFKSNIKLNQIRVDKKSLSTLINNLIHNAIQHSNKSDENKIIIKAETNKSKRFLGKKYLYFSVTNDGFIPEENSDKIYENGFSTKKNSFNSGKGLSECFSIIKKIDGELYHKNQDKKVTFYMKVPI